MRLSLRSDKRLKPLSDAESLFTHGEILAGSLVLVLPGDTITLEVSLPDAMSHLLSALSRAEPYGLKYVYTGISAQEEWAKLIETLYSLSLEPGELSPAAVERARRSILSALIVLPTASFPAIECSKCQHEYSGHDVSRSDWERNAFIGPSGQHEITRGIRYMCPMNHEMASIVFDRWLAMYPGE